MGLLDIQAVYTVYSHRAREKQMDNIRNRSPMALM